MLFYRYEIAGADDARGGEEDELDAFDRAEIWHNGDLVAAYDRSGNSSCEICQLIILPFSFFFLPSHPCSFFFACSFLPPE